MPHVVAAVIVGAGFAAGLTWVAKELKRAAQAARDAGDRLQPQPHMVRVPKDLGTLVWDAEAGVYRPGRHQS